VRLRIVVLLGLAACQPDTDELALELDFEDSCTPDLFAQIRQISVEVSGSDADGGMCVLASRCTELVDAAMPLATAADFEAELRDLEPKPLIDTPAEGALFVNIFGRTSETFCWQGPGVACGSTDVDNAVDGALRITIQCGDDCPEEDVPLCP
jgi:hypothetical protein